MHTAGAKGECQVCGGRSQCAVSGQCQQRAPGSTPTPHHPRLPPTALCWGPKSSWGVGVRIQNATLDWMESSRMSWGSQLSLLFSHHPRWLQGPPSVLGPRAQHLEYPRGHLQASQHLPPGDKAIPSQEGDRAYWRHLQATCSSAERLREGLSLGSTASKQEHGLWSQTSKSWLVHPLGEQPGAVLHLLVPQFPYV